MSPQESTPEEQIPLEIAFTNVPRGTLEKIFSFAKLFWDWNHHINLTGEKSFASFLERQIADCLGAGTILPKNNIWLDIGTGGGLPGIVWALLAPERKFFLMESLQKKISFLHRATQQLAIPNVEISGMRFETLSNEPDKLKKLQGAALVTRGTAAPEDILRWAAESPLDWSCWTVFVSEKTEADFLTLNKKFGMKAEAFEYMRRPHGPGEKGKLIVLQR